MRKRESAVSSASSIAHIDDVIPDSRHPSQHPPQMLSAMPLAATARNAIFSPKGFLVTLSPSPVIPVIGDVIPVPRHRPPSSIQRQRKSPRRRLLRGLESPKDQKRAKRSWRWRTMSSAGTCESAFSCAAINAFTLAAACSGFSCAGAAPSEITSSTMPIA